MCKDEEKKADSTEVEIEPRYCALCGLTAGPDGCQHSGIKYTADEMWTLTEIEESQKNK